jgi:hypothetical protein
MAEQCTSCGKPAVCAWRILPVMAGEIFGCRTCDPLARYAPGELGRSFTYRTLPEFATAPPAGATLATLAPLLRHRLNPGITLGNDG